MTQDFRFRKARPTLSVHRALGFRAIVLAAGGTVVAMCLWAASAFAGNPDRAAEFTVGNTVAQTLPPGFGAEYEMQQRVNNWTDNPGMEGLRADRYFEPSSFGSDANGYYYICNTRFYDTLDSGFFDGATYRIYREVPDGSGNTIVTRVAEGIVPLGGYVAAGYMQIGVNGLATYWPATDATDDVLMTNGSTWYYAVQAVDTKGNTSAYSAPIAGVTPLASYDNGPRIKTGRVPDPTVGTAYTASSPLVKFAAAGGQGTVTFTVSAGAIPAGMILDTNGALRGTCTSNTEATFTIRATDSIGRTHDRQFVVLRSRPAAADPAPAAPTNVQVEANNGFVHLTWDAPADTDIDHYNIVRSRQPASEHMERIYLEPGAPAPASGDMLFLSKDFVGAPAASTRSVRIYSLQSDTGWATQLGGTAQAANVKQQIVPHPAPLPTAMQAENPGLSCLKITNTGTGEFGIYTYKFGGSNDTWWDVNMLKPGRHYRIECWVRSESMASTSIRFTAGQYLDQTVSAALVPNTWVKVSRDFTPSAWLPNNISVGTVSYRFTGPGTVYIDNALLYCLDEPRGPAGLTQDSLDMWQQYSGPASSASKGATRVRYFTDPLQHILNPSVMSMCAWNVNYGAQSQQELHLGDALQISYESGATSATRQIPWITGSLQWTEAEWLAFMEYLAGPAGTPYGDLRIAQRGGVTTPWTDEFPAINIEMSNEPWNAGYFFAFRGGFGSTSARTYGRFCEYIWSYIEANSPYWTPIDRKVRVSLGGWSNGDYSLNNYGTLALKECPHASALGYTSYLGGWERNDPVGGTVWSDEGVQQWCVYNDRSGKGEIDGLTTLRTLAAAAGMPFRALMYEGGPSYLMNGLNGVSLTTQEQETSRNYGRTFAAGIGTLDFWLYGSLQGVGEQEFFTFSQDQGLWCSHTAVQTGYRPHPAWILLGMVNQYVQGWDMLVASPVSLPTYDMMDPANPTVVYKADIPLAACYAFKKGSSLAVLVLNKKLDGVHDSVDFGTGVTSVTLHLPFDSASTITLHRVVGDPRLTNRDALRFQVETSTIPAAAFSPDFAVGAATGGTGGSMPMGVYLYVFDGIVATPLPVNPQAVVTVDPTQPDPQNGSVANAVKFLVTFDRPVTGFGDSSSDVTLGGTAGAFAATVAPVAGSLGTSYLVTVGPMPQAGTVTLAVPAGAAQSAADGAPSDPATYTDNEVTVYFPTGMSLLEWEFGSLPSGTDWHGLSFAQNPASSYNHPYILPTNVLAGPGTTTDVNPWYNDDAFAVGRVNSTSFDANDYVAWIVTPTTGTTLSLQSMRFGTFDSTSGNNLNIAMCWSIDNFTSYTAATLTPAGPIAGTGLGSSVGTAITTDLTGFAALQNLTVPVQFRFYMWGASSQYTQSGIGKLGPAAVDLAIRGLALRSVLSPPTAASNPAPINGATNVSTTTLTLQWTSGSGTVTHALYLGTAQPLGPANLVANPVNASWTPTVRLAGGTTYYWRVDETNAGGTTSGPTWSFTTLSPAVLMKPAVVEPRTWQFFE